MYLKVGDKVKALKGLYVKWRDRRRLKRKQNRLAWYENKKRLFLTTDNTGVLSKMLFNLPTVRRASTYPVGAISTGMEIELDDGWRTSTNKLMERDCIFVCAGRVLEELARRENIEFDWLEEIEKA